MLWPNPKSKLGNKYKKDCSFGFEPVSRETVKVAISNKYFAGQIVPNDTKPYDISIIFAMTDEKYKKVYDYCTPKVAPRYHIAKFNCATFALAALESAGIKHRFKKKYWSLGVLRWFLGVANLRYYGYTPAQMGYDLATGRY